MAERIAVHDRENLFVCFSEGDLEKTNDDQYTLTGSIIRTPDQELDIDQYDHASRMSLSITKVENKLQLSLHAVSPVIQRNNYLCFHETNVDMVDGKTNIVSKGNLVFKRKIGSVKVVPMRNDRKTDIKTMRENDHLKILTTLPPEKHQILTMNTYRIGAFNSIKSVLGLDIKQLERSDNKKEVDRLRHQQSIYQFYFDIHRNLRIQKYNFSDTTPNQVVLTF